MRARQGAPASHPRNGAEVKKDILGFSPGMSKEEFLDRRKNGCGGLSAHFTTKLDQNLVKEIEFKFISGTPPVDMILQITEQFKIKPVKSDWRAEIQRATEVRPCKVLWSETFCVGGLIAKWRLDENLSLNLTLNSPAAGTRPNDYILTLSSEAVAKL